MGGLNPFFLSSSPQSKLASIDCLPPGTLLINQGNGEVENWESQQVKSAYLSYKYGCKELSRTFFGGGGKGQKDLVLCEMVLKGN